MKNKPLPAAVSSIEDIRAALERFQAVASNTDDMVFLTIQQKQEYRSQAIFDYYTLDEAIRELESYRGMLE